MYLKSVKADPSIYYKIKRKLQTINTCLRNILSTEIRDNSIDKIVPHDDRTDRFPIAGVFAE